MLGTGRNGFSEKKISELNVRELGSHLSALCGRVAWAP